MEKAPIMAAGTEHLVEVVMVTRVTSDKSDGGVVFVVYVCSLQMMVFITEDI